MPKNKDIFSIAAVKRVMKESIPRSISQDATKEVIAHITSYTAIKAKKAVENAEHAGRSTILEKDLRL